KVAGADPIEESRTFPGFTASDRPEDLVDTPVLIASLVSHLEISLERAKVVSQTSRRWTMGRSTRRPLFICVTSACEQITEGSRRYFRAPPRGRKAFMPPKVHSGLGAAGVGAPNRS